MTAQDSTKNLLSQFKNYLQKKGLSYNTIRNYLTDIKKFNDWFYQDLENPPVLTALSSSHFEKYKGYLSERKNFSDATLKRNCAALKVFSDFLLEGKIIKESILPKKKKVSQVTFFQIPAADSFLRFKVLTLLAMVLVLISSAVTIYLVLLVNKQTLILAELKEKTGLFLSQNNTYSVLSQWEKVSSSLKLLTY